MEASLLCLCCLHFCSLPLSHCLDGYQGGSNGVSGALYATSMELCATLPLLPRTRSEEALLVAALQGMPVPLLAAADVAVVLDGAAGSNATAAVYAFGPSQPGIYLVTVRPVPFML